MSVSISGAGSISGLDQGFNVTTGNVGIGTDDASWGVSTGLIVGDGASAKGITIFSNSANVGDLAFADSTSGTARYRGLIRYDHSDNSLALRTNSTERLRIDSNGRLLLGSGAISLPKGSGAGSFDLDNGSITMCIGGNINSTGRTNSTDKIARFTAPHYTNAEQPVLIASAYNVSGNNTISYGGGTSLCNAATSHIFYTATDTTTVTGTERLRITSDGNVNIKGGNLSVGLDSATLDFTDSNSNTKFVEIGASGGDALLVTHSSGAGVGYFGYEVGGDRLVVACDNGGGANKIDFIVNAGTTTGGSTDNLNNVSPALRIDSAGNIIFGNQSGAAETSSAIKNIDGGRDYWNGTAGDYRALRYKTYYTNTDDAYGMGVSASLLEFQSQTNMGFFTGSAGAASGRRVERMRIDSSGRVTMPYQPCFFATSNTGGSNTSTGYTGIISDQLEAAYVNVGNHYNTSTGVFTCPVAGTYEFTAQGLIRYQTGAGRAELSFFKNGANTISRSYGYTWVTGASDHDSLHVMGYITCAANDQIDLRVYNMDSGVDCYFAQGLGYFAGRLVQ